MRTKGRVVFLPGETRHVVRIELINDTKHESDETFTIELHDAKNATIDRAIRIVASSQVGRVTQVVVRRPLGEAHFHDQFRVYEPGVRWQAPVGERTGVGWLSPKFGTEPVEFGFVEAGADLTDVTQRTVGVVDPEEERSDPIRSSPWPGTQPPTTNSWRRWCLTLRHDFERRPDSYRESKRFATTPSNPSRALAEKATLPSCPFGGVSQASPRAPSRSRSARRSA